MSGPAPRVEGEQRQPGGGQGAATGAVGSLSPALQLALAPRPWRLGVPAARAVSIVVGGAGGALARAGIAKGLPAEAGQWPWATFTVNLAGALLLGWLLTRLTERIALTQHWRTLLGTGLCGALTTFSSFQIDTISLGRDGHVGIAAAYAVSSMVLGMVCAIAGTVVARWGRYG